MTAVNAADATTPGPPPLFEATLSPHRSLGPAGVRWVAGSLCLLSAGISAGLWIVGAWPVIGFNAAEILLVVLLLRRNARAARATETLQLSEAGLRIVRTGMDGRRWERRLDGAWLTAVLEERPGRTPGLFVSSRGLRVEVGAELGEAEKRELAAALREALRRQQNPVFDNPQLMRPPGPST